MVEAQSPLQRRLLLTLEADIAMIDTVRIAIAAIAILWLPGQAIGGVIKHRAGSQPGLATSVGLSVAGIPLLVLYASLARIGVSRAFWIAVSLLSGLVAGFCLKKPPPLFVRRIKSQPTGWWHSIVAYIQPSWIAMAFVFTLALLLRFVQIRDLVLPAWVDSLHHTMVVEIIRAQGRIPNDLRPYMPLPFYYYFGFHTLTAAFADLAGLASPQAVLIFGQILNASVLLSIYRLGTEIARRWEVGVGAALLTGFVFRMPAYYVSWGRYTLLAGMVLLPLAMATALAVSRQPNQGNRLQLAIVTGGIVLAHYLAAIYFLGFLLSLALVILADGKSLAALRRSFNLLLWSGLGIVLVAPWLIRITPYILPSVQIRVGGINTPFNRGEFPSLGYLWSLVNHPHVWVILPLAAFAGATSIIVHRPSRTLVLWIGILVLLSTPWPWLIHPFRIDLLVITLFIPGSVLASESLYLLHQWVSKLAPSLFISRYLWHLVLLLLGGWGFLTTLSIVNPVTILATAEDVKALHWIAQNVPAGAKFLINVEPWYHGIYRGSDGGWWIPLVSHRATILPPSINFGRDAEGGRYASRVRQVAEQAMAIDGCTDDFWRFVREHSITHIYIGARGGNLQPRWFDTCTGVRRIYMGYNVHIYRIEGATADFQEALDGSEKQGDRSNDW